MYYNELYHHGIQGQKWGIRRYQNEDGTLTAEGREHYGYGEHERYYKDSNGNIIPKKDVKAYKEQRRYFKPDGTPTFRKRFKDHMTYQDENGKNHLSKSGKIALAGAGAIAGAGVVGGTIAMIARSKNKKKMDHARRVFASFGNNTVGDFTPAVVEKGRRITMRKILGIGQRKFSWE